MSEHNLPIADQAEIAASVSVQPKSFSKGPAWLALLIALLGLGAGGWSAWQLYQQQGQSAAQVAQLEQSAAQVLSQAKQSEQHIAQRLAGLPSAADIASQRDLLLSLQGEQQRLSQSLNQLLGQSRQDWRLAEAEHLLRLAMLRLSALHDTHGALALVEGAEEIVRAQNDPNAFATRAQLIKLVETLRSLPEVDRSGLFLKLAALREQAAGLQALAPEFIQQQAELNDSAVPVVEDFWDGLWREVSRHVRIDWDADQAVRPHLAGQTLAQVRLALSLALEQAQWAALNGQPEVYQSALASADQLLQEFFDVNNPAVQALRARIKALTEAVVVTEMPDMSSALSSLQAYLKKREAAQPDVSKENEQ